MEKTKLKINTVAGIVDIVNAILFISSLFVVFTTAVGEVFSDGNGSVTATTGGFFYLMAGVGLILHIVGLVKSKKVGISIVGCGIFLLSMLFALPAMVLMILAAIFTLMQKNLEVK